jgi:hypothetical protein
MAQDFMWIREEKEFSKSVLGMRRKDLTKEVKEKWQCWLMRRVWLW